VRPFERRQANAYPYFSIAKWDAKFCTWRELGKVYALASQAKASALVKGRYRLSRIDETGMRTDLELWEVT